MAKPITSGRGDAEDFRSRSEVRDGFFLDGIDVACDDAAIDVEPELPLVHTANPAQADLSLADLAIPRAGGAHDLVRPFDRPPQLGDLAHRFAGWLANVEDFRFRNHRYPYTAPLGAKYFVRGLPDRGRPEVLPALRQERFLPGFRQDYVPTRGRDLSNHRQSRPPRRRRRGSLEERLQSIRADGREEFVVASVVQGNVLRDRGRQGREAAVKRQRVELDLVREVRHRRELGEAHSQAIREVDAAGRGPGGGEELALGDPRIGTQQLVQGVRPWDRGLLQHFRGVACTAQVSRDDDHVPGLRAGPKEDPTLGHAAERGPGDGQARGFLRVSPEDREVEFAGALVHPLGEAAEELDVRVRGHRERGDEAQGPRPGGGDVAQVHGGRIPADLRGRRAGGNVRLLIHDVRRDDEVFVAPGDGSHVMAEPDRLPAVVDPREDLDGPALADVGESR